MNEENLKEDYEQLSTDAKKLIGKVIEIEKAKKHMGNPRGVNQEILKTIEEIVE